MATTHHPFLVPGTLVAQYLGLGENRLGDARRRLEEQGVRVIAGAKGHWLVTKDALDYACGVPVNQEPQREELL